MGRIGIAISGGPSPAEIVDLVVLAESLGYDSAWIAEGMAVTSSRSWQLCHANFARPTWNRISSVIVRTAPTIAMAASSIADSSGGRIMPGLGSSHKVQVEPEHGVTYGKPLASTRETVAIVRALIRDGRVRFDGETVRIENFDLWFTPRHRDVPVYLAAVFARGVALAGEIADGVILTRSTLDTAATVRQQLSDAAHQAGRDPGAIEITTVLPTAVADTGETALAVLRPRVALYAGYFPRYNRLMAEHEFVSEATEIAIAWARGDRETAEHAVSDSMIEATSIVGTREQCRAGIEA